MKNKVSLNKNYLVLIFGILAVMFGVQALVYRLELINSENNIDLTSQVGDLVIRRDIALEVNSVRSDRTIIPGYWQLAENKKFVIVDITFKNRTNKNYSLSPITTMKLIDKDGVNYEVTSAVSITNGLGGEVLPDQTVTGEVGFTVPISQNEFEFEFRPTIGSKKTIVTNFVLDK